jgi:hypothetical protein
MVKKIQNKIGKKFGSLIVISRSLLKPELEDKDPRSLWHCLCDCGNTREVPRSRLREKWSMQEGSFLSCGCSEKRGIKLRKDPVLGSARATWSSKYKDGCSFDKFLELSQQPCFWCGALPSNKSTGSAKGSGEISSAWRKIKVENPFIYNGLDRIDSNRDHSEDNIVPCCADCNRAKMSRTTDEFRFWIDKIYHKQFPG